MIPEIFFLLLCSILSVYLFIYFLGGGSFFFLSLVLTVAVLFWSCSFVFGGLG